MRVVAVVIVWATAIAFAGILALSAGIARDLGQWQDADPKLRAWFESLKQPDTGVSCCGDADSYYADVYEVRDGKVFATITDNRGNPVAVGTEVEIPPHKMNRDPNMTGHTVLFLSPGGHVYCFIPGSGV